MRLLKYTLDDVFCGEEKIPSFAVAFKLHPKGIMLHKVFGWTDGKGYNSYAYSFYDGESEHKQIAVSKHMSGYHYAGGIGKYKIFGLDNETYLSFPFNDTIYRVDPNTGLPYAAYVTDLDLRRNISADMEDKEVAKIRVSDVPHTFSNTYAWTDLSYLYENAIHSLAFDTDSNVIFNGVFTNDDNGLPVDYFLQYESPDASENRLISVLMPGSISSDREINQSKLLQEIESG